MQQAIVRLYQHFQFNSLKPPIAYSLLMSVKFGIVQAMLYLSIYLPNSTTFLHYQVIRKFKVNMYSSQYFGRRVTHNSVNCSLVFVMDLCNLQHICGSTVWVFLI
jgi:hypothetical protein